MILTERERHLAAIHGGDLHAGPDVGIEQQPEVALVAHDQARLAAAAYIDLHLPAAPLAPLALGLIILKQRPIACSPERVNVP